MRPKFCCGCIPVLAAVVFVAVLACKRRSYEFELNIRGNVPDFNQYAIIYVVDNKDHNMAYGYRLYHSAMRENGLKSLILMDRLFRYVDALFGGARIRPSGLESMDGESFFGDLPEMVLPEQTDLIDVVGSLKPVRDAHMAIETNAVFSSRWYGRIGDFDVLHWSCIWSGIGRPWEGYDRDFKDEPVPKAKEALTACAIKVIFKDMRTPRIEETSSIAEDIIMMHGRVPFPVRTNVVTRRSFNFYSANGALFATLHINLAYNRLLLHNIDDNDEMYKAIFRQVFSELKAAKGKQTIRGRAYCDPATSTGVISDLKHMESP